MRKGLIVLLCVLVVGSHNAWSKKPKLPVECLQRDPSLTESACAERLRPGAPIMPQCAYFQGEGYRLCVVRQPSDEILTQRKQEEVRIQAIHLRLDAKLEGAGVYLPSDASRLPTPQETVLALGSAASTDEMTRAYNNARAREVKAVEAGLNEIVEPSEVQSIEAEQSARKKADGMQLEADKLAKQSRQQASAEGSCEPAHLVGTSIEHIHYCFGQPDHINSDAYIDQLVYPNDLFVYIDRSTGMVENVQWTH